MAQFELVKFTNSAGINVTFTLAKNESEVIKSYEVKSHSSLTINPELEFIQTIWIIASPDGHDHEPSKQLIDLSKSSPSILFIEAIEVEYIVGFANGRVKCSFE